MYPAWTKSTNPKKWRNIVYMQNEFLSFLTNVLNRPTIRFMGLFETDLASIDNIRDLGKGMEMIIAWAKSVCNIRVGSGAGDSGLSLSPVSREVFADFVIVKFPVFLRDKDRAQFSVKIYTDINHGGSVVIWCDPLTFSDIPSATQFKVMCFRVADYAMGERKKYTRR